MKIILDNCCIRTFQESDIEKKVFWINNPENNCYLHYTLPLTIDGTKRWFEKVNGDSNRIDCTILYNEMPVGVIGLLDIDQVNKKAEYYICIGEQDYKGKGIARKASELLIKYAFEKAGINKIYLYTEEENKPAQKLFERLGFRKEGLIRDDLIYCGRVVNRYVYGLLKEEYNV